VKIPTTPPNVDNHISELIKQGNHEKLSQILKFKSDNKDCYLHWDKLQHLTPPSGFTAKDYWVNIKLARQAIYQQLPLLDKYQKPFQFALVNLILKKLDWINQNLNINRAIKKNIFHELMDEAISSSQLEGASTTRVVAKEMLRLGRTPRNRSEQMIANNYNAMQFIKTMKNDLLSKSMIFELHRILTEGTLDNPKAAGKFRTAEDNIHIVNIQNSQTLHTPPDAEQLSERLDALCKFANDTELFMPAILKAIILHFILAYDHPFVDGNGRTARALFYWFMIKQNYWIIDFISISAIIKQAPIQYARAFLYTETDDNDTTYFIIHQLEVMEKAIKNLYKNIEEKTNNIENIEQSQIAEQLNHRQINLLEHAIKHPHQIYSIEEHQKYHNISRQTARKDLIHLAEKMQLLRKRKVGNTFVFVSPSDLKHRI
jgi:Fic family protein